MEELTLDQIKKKSELEEDIDFEKGDYFLLLTVLYDNVETCALVKVVGGYFFHRFVPSSSWF